MVFDLSIIHAGDIIEFSAERKTSIKNILSYCLDSFFILARLEQYITIIIGYDGCSTLFCQNIQASSPVQIRISRFQKEISASIFFQIIELFLFCLFTDKNICFEMVEDIFDHQIDVFLPLRRVKSNRNVKSDI